MIAIKVSKVKDLFTVAAEGAVVANKAGHGRTLDTALGEWLRLNADSLDIEINLAPEVQANEAQRIRRRKMISRAESRVA